MSEEQVQDREREEDEDNGFATAWRPERKGDRVKGNVAEIALIDPGGQGAYPCVTLTTTEGPVAVHAFHTVLRRELARRAPKIGDEIEVIYLGKVAGGSYDREYHNYRASGGQAREFDWSQELPADERALTSDPQAGEPPIAPAPVLGASDRGTQTAKERVEASLPPIPEYDENAPPF